MSVGPQFDNQSEAGEKAGGVIPVRVSDEFCMATGRMTALNNETIGISKLRGLEVSLTVRSKN